MIEISGVSLEKTADGHRLSGTVAGHELWFRVYGDARLERRGEPFFGVALLLAMSRGENIVVDPAAPISADFARSLHAVQSLLLQWTPGFKRVEVDAALADMPALNDGVLCSFSAGVDSMHCFIENKDEITHLLTIGGYDYLTGPKTDFELVLEKMEAFAREFGKTLVAVDTNSRAVCDALKLNWKYAQGPILCSLAVGMGFDKYIIPANHSYRDLKPFGTHPLLDPLWSTSRTAVAHVGLDAFRTEKTANIAANPAALKHLQVCWHSQVENCGRCSKCVRTALVLRLLGVTDYPIPCPDPFSKLEVFTAKSEFSASMVWDTMNLARRQGARDVEQALRATLRRYVIKRNIDGIVKAVFSNSVRDRLRKRTWNERSVLLSDPSDFQ